MPALRLNSSAARWLAVPAPDVPKVRLSGFALASATSSRTLLAGTEGCATSTLGTTPSSVTGASALPRSKSEWVKTGLMVCATVAMNSM